MAETDRYGLPIATASADAAAHYRAGIDLMLAAWPGAEAALDRGIAADPGFALAQIARGRLHQMYAEVPQARACAARARELAMTASERERSHVETIAASIEGQPARALELALAHVERWPRDAMILALPLGAFGLYAFSGRADHDRARVDLCERHARHYGDDWWFLTYLGWSHTEAGNVGAGRTVTERAMALRRENANASHALAHALLEQGDSDAGTRLIADWLPIYDTGGILNGHIAWHLALLLIDEGDCDAALRLYRDRIRPQVSKAPSLNVFTDAASLLWRAGLRGGAVDARDWQDVAEYGRSRFGQAGVHFADLHAALTAAAVGDTADLDTRVTALEARASAGKLAPGEALPRYCRALGDFAAGRYEAAASAITANLGDLVRLGGSHAQREVVEDTAIVAWLRAGRPADARRLIDARLHKRPSRRDRDWLAQSDA